MRKLLFFPFLLLALTATACNGDPIEPEGSATEQPETPGNDNDEDETPDNDGRYLVLYCSRTSNTESVAQRIGTTLGCDLIEVEPGTPYDTDYNAMLERSQQEQAAIETGNFPPVKTSVESFEEYDIIFIGYPIWYSHMATPMQTFLHEHAAKLAGKRIALFATSGSSGISTSVSDARKHCPDATYTESLLLTSGTLSQAESRVAEWLSEIGVTTKN